MAHSSLDHVMDTNPEGRPVWEFFHGMELPLPEIFGFQITKFMLLELIAAGLIILIFVPLARRARSGALPKGAWWNCFESLLTFVRNEIAKPNLDPPPGHGEHHDHAHPPAHAPDHEHHDHAHTAQTEPHGPSSGLTEAGQSVPE